MFFKIFKNMISYVKFILKVERMLGEVYCDFFLSKFIEFV